MLNILTVKSLEYSFFSRRFDSQSDQASDTQGQLLLKLEGVEFTGI